MSLCMRFCKDIRCIKKRFTNPPKLYFKELYFKKLYIKELNFYDL
jgi:hypothetical protein